ASSNSSKKSVRGRLVFTCSTCPPVRSCAGTRTIRLRILTRPTAVNMQPPRETAHRSGAGLLRWDIDMRLILFRHGPAGERDANRWPDDSERPLTLRGAQLTRRAAAGLARLEPGIEQVATSPFVRARETARVLADVLRIGEVEELDALRPGGSVDAI